MKQVIEEIKKALVRFSHADLCEGSEVRDTLLDLLLVAQAGSDPSTPEYSPDGQMYATTAYVEGVITV